MTTKVNRMTPQEALDLLDQVSAQATGNREVHDKIREAVNVLQVVIDKLLPNLICPTSELGENNG